MEIINLYPGDFASACYLLTEGEDAVLIDCSAPVSSVREALSRTGATLRAILCTHGHFDHVLTADDMREAFGVPLLIHEADAEMLTDGHKNAFALFAGYEKAWRAAERTFTDGEQLTFGALTLTVRHTPGHSRGSSMLFTGEIAFSGDTVFANTFGRTDLYGGNPAMLYRTLLALKELPPETVIYPGHGAAAPLGDALHNIFSKNS